MVGLYRRQFVVRSITPYLRYVSAMLVCGFATPAFAERAEDKVWLQGGVFRAQVDTYARVDSPSLGLPGTRVDFEGDLGLDDKEWAPKIAGGVRLGKAFRIEADYFSLNRAGSTTLNRLLGVDDTVFPVGAVVDSSFDTKIWRIAGGWSPVLTDTTEVGLAIGVHLTDASFSISGTLPGVSGATLVERRATTIPLPNIGLYANHSFNKTFGIHAKADFFSIKLGDYKGRLIDAQLGFSARIQRNIGVGIAYRFVDYDVEVRKNDFGGKIEYKYYGPVAFVEVAF